MSFGFYQVPITTKTNVSGDNTALTLTLSASTGQRWLLFGYSIATRGATLSTGDKSIAIKDSTTVVWRETLGSAAPRGTRLTQNFVPPFPGSKNNQMTLEIPACGAGTFIAASLWAIQVDG